MKYFDIHSHLTEKRFNENRHQIITEMAEKEIFTISIGTDQEESQKAVGLARSYKNVYASVGQHPVDNTTEEFDQKFYNQLIESNRDRIVCVGECGLDYYWPKKDIQSGKSTPENFAVERRRQINLFEKQIDLAAMHDLPLMLHVRSFENADAHRDTFDILEQKQLQYGGKLRANFHFFTETAEIARMVVDRGFTVSFPGVITFADLDIMVRDVPIDHIMSETDSPYAAPVPFRGQDATPLMVPAVVAKIAEIKNLDEQEVREKMIENAKNFFNV